MLDAVSPYWVCYPVCNHVRVDGKRRDSAAEREEIRRYCRSFLLGSMRMRRHSYSDDLAATCAPTHSCVFFT
eukprot:6189935-Pleurochrysis_carterae.AAC.3